ncbi:MAG: TolC family protein [Planctomycetes bacterium]|nr:TolC family protein [Planctomycetota bacterium]
MRPPLHPRRTASRLCTLALALIPLAGCEIDQKQEVATYRKIVDTDAPAQLNRLAPGEPLTLEHALALANRDNERVDIEGENYLQAIIAKKRVVAEFLPTISVAPTFIANHRISGPPARHHSLDVPIEGGYGDFNTIRSVEDYRRAAATIDQRLALLLDLKATVLLGVVQSYYQVLRTEQQVVVLRNSLAVQEERVHDVEAQIEAGTGRPLDLAQARAQAASTRVLVVQAVGDTKIARDVLAFLIGAPTVDGPLDDRFVVPEQIAPQESYELRALEHRQDLIAAQQAVLAARHGVDSAFAQYYPSVSINLDYFMYRETVPTASLYTALLQANIPIFTSGRIHEDVRAAWSVFRQAKLTESLTRRRVLQEVKAAHQDLFTSIDRLRELAVQVKAAQDAFEQSVDLVKFGRATNLERLVAQDQLLTAQLQFTSETFNNKSAYLNLQRVAGLLGIKVESAATQPATQPTTQPMTQPTTTTAITP